MEDHHLNREYFLKILLVIFIILMVYYGFQKGGMDRRIFHNFGKDQKLFNTSEISSTPCAPARNIYFLKMHKTGSSTFNVILSRYAWTHNLTMATFSDQPFESNASHPIITKLIPPYDGKLKYNVMTYHAVYDEDDINKILHAEGNLQFITLVREPLARLRSFLNFYPEMTHKAGLKTQYPVEELIYKLRNSNEKKPVRFEPIRDTMAYEFGKFSNLSAQSEDFKRKVKHLSDRFFVGLTEYYTETVILLRRLLCLKSHKDVMFLHLRQFSYKSRPNKKRNRKILCEWSDKDCYLYDFFNKTFWKRIKDQGQDFREEVDHMNLLNVLVNNYCRPVISFIKGNGWPLTRNETHRFKTLKIPASKWSSSFFLSPMDCAFMYLDDRTLQILFYYIQNPQKCKTLAEQRCPFGKYTQSITDDECRYICKGDTRKEDILLRLLSLKNAYLFEGVDSIRKGL